MVNGNKQKTMMLKVRRLFLEYMYTYSFQKMDSNLSNIIRKQFNDSRNFALDECKD